MQKNYFLYGNDLISLSRRIEQIKKNLSDTEQVKIEKINIEKTEDLELFYNTGSNSSLFPETSVFVISINNKIFKLLEKDFEDFTSLLKKISVFKTIIVVLHIERFDKDTKNQIISSNLSNVLKPLLSFEEYIKLKPWQTEQIKEKVKQLAQDYELQFDDSALSLFVDRFKEDTDSIKGELEKLQLYLLPEKYIDVELVKTLYLNGFSIDDLFDSIISGKRKNIFSLIETLSTTQAPLYVLAALQNRFRQALQIKVCKESNINIYQISKLLGIHSFRIEKELPKLSKISLVQLKEIISKLSEIEFKVKTGILPDKQAIDMMVL